MSPFASRRHAPLPPVSVPTGVITGIVASPRAPGRFDVAVDGHGVARLPVQGIERLGLRVGLELDDRTAAALGAEATIARAYDRAMQMLAARGRARGELQRLLVRKGEPEDAVRAALDRLVANGLVDDEQFSRAFARSRATAGVSRLRIAQELGRRGVDRTVATEAIDAAIDEEGIDESAAIEAAAGKKLRTMGSLDLPTRRRRLSAWLARRGFPPDEIRRVVDGLG